MTILFSNNASTTIAGSITATTTSVALAAGTGVLFPNPTGGDYFCATFYDQATKTQNEIVHVIARAGDTCTIVRAQEGTVAQAWSAADIFANLVTAGTLNAFVQAGTGPADTSLVYVGTDVSTTPNIVICTTNPVPPSYEVGMLFNIKIKNTNNGPVQLQFNGLAGVRASRTNGSDMVGGNVTASEEMIFVYNGVDFTSMVPPVPQTPPVTTFYVRTDGNDNNSGFANTPQDAFRTVSGAMYQIKARYISQNAITIRVADGYYIDAIYDNVAYIAAWNLVGNPSNPGNVVIDASSPSQGAYPPYASIARAVVAYDQAQITVNGFTFHSFFDNAATAGGSLGIYNCNFTSPTSGAAACIFSNENGNLNIYGVCNLSAAQALDWIFVASYGGTMGLGWHDQLSTVNLLFNINGTPTIAGATAAADSTGSVFVFNAAVAFTGGIPNCPQFMASSCGGVSFQSGVTTAFPGTQPGIVVPPGYTN
jgi:hypothetical protein